MRNRKGFVYSFGIVIITLIVIVSAIIFHFQNKSPENLGSTQSLILETYQQAQLNMLETNLKAKFSEVETIYFLAAHSGFVSNDCGAYYGVPLLSYKNPRDNYTKCNQSYEVQFEIKFKDLLEKKLRERFSYFVKKTSDSINIKGISKQQKSIGFNDQKDFRKYNYADSFNKELDYDFYIYDKLIPYFIDQLNEECSEYENNKILNDLDDCVEEFVDYYNSNLQLSSSDPWIYLDEEILNDKDLKTIQQIKNMEETNFQYCYYGNKNEFSFSDMLFTETNLRFINNDDMKDSSVYFVRGGNLLNYTNLYPVDYSFYRGEFKNNNILPVDLRKSNYYLNLNDDELIHQISGEKVDVSGIDLYKCDRENENMVCLLDEQTVDDQKDFLDLRPCEFENRKYIFYLDDEEYYPEEGPLTYRFSTYVKDEIEPEFKEDFFEVVSKDFAEDVVLIVWPHSKSNDVTTYDLYLNDELVKKINPWVDMKIYDEIDWNYGRRQNNNVMDACQVEKEGSYYQCYYSFDDGKGLLENDNVYFFKNNNEFVYVMDLSDKNLQKNKIKIKINDDDRNSFETKEKKAELEDRLPLLAVDSKLSVPNYMGLIAQTIYGSEPIYEMVIYSAPFKSKNMDGSDDLDESGNLLIYHQPDYDFDFLEDSIMTKTARSPAATSQMGPYSLYYNVYYVIQQEDESMDYLNEIPVDLYGHKKHLVNMEFNGDVINGGGSII